MAISNAAPRFEETMQPLAATPGIAKPGANGTPTDLIDAVSAGETDGAVVIAAPVATSRSHADSASASTVTQHADTNVRIGVPFNRPFLPTACGWCMQIQRHRQMRSSRAAAASGKDSGARHATV